VAAERRPRHDAGDGGHWSTARERGPTAAAGRHGGGGWGVERVGCWGGPRGKAASCEGEGGVRDGTVGSGFGGLRSQEKRIGRSGPSEA